MTDVSIKGLAELGRFLKQVTPKMERAIMRSALRAGAAVILKQARANVPVRTGDLRKSLRVSTRARGGGVVTASVKSNLFYATMVEYGTRAHWISVDASARPERNTRHGVKKFSVATLNRFANRGSLKIGTHFIGASVSHPGSQPRPFLRPALDQMQAAATMAVGQKIKDRLTMQGLNGADNVRLEGDE